MDKILDKVLGVFEWFAETPWRMALGGLILLGIIGGLIASGADWEYLAAGFVVGWLMSR